MRVPLPHLPIGKPLLGFLCGNGERKIDTQSPPSEKGTQGILKPAPPQHTMSPAMNPRHHVVHVPRRLRNKVAKAEQELAEQGVGVEFDVRVKRHIGNGGREYYLFSNYIFPSWDTVSHVWLAFTILQKAIGAWPKLREILVNAGLTNDEITTLGLSKFTRQRAKKTWKKKS